MENGQNKKIPIRHIEVDIARIQFLFWKYVTTHCLTFSTVQIDTHTANTSQGKQISIFRQFSQVLHLKLH